MSSLARREDTQYLLAIHAAHSPLYLYIRSSGSSSACRASRCPVVIVLLLLLSIEWRIATAEMLSINMGTPRPGPGGIDMHMVINRMNKKNNKHLRPPPTALDAAHGMQCRAGTIPACVRRRDIACNTTTTTAATYTKHRFLRGDRRPALCTQGLVCDGDAPGGGGRERDEICRAREKY